MKPLLRPDVKKLKRLHRYNGRVAGGDLCEPWIWKWRLEPIMSPLIQHSMTPVIPSESRGIPLKLPLSLRSGIPRQTRDDANADPALSRRVSALHHSFRRACARSLRVAPYR